MNTAELSEAWNSLRNAALGKTTTPNVKPALARLVAREYEAWRRQLFASPWKGDPMPPWIWDQVATYRRVLAKVKAAGIRPKKTLAPTTLEELGEWSRNFSRNLAIGLGIFGAGYVAFALIGMGRNNGR